MPSFFGRVFGGSKSSGSASAGAGRDGREGKKAKRARKGDGEESLDKAAGFASKEMMNDAERQIFQYRMPTQTLGLSDLIDKHKQGERFQYIALTGNDTETFEARTRRIITFRPKLNKSMIPVEDLPHIKLVRDSENLPLSSVLPKKVKDYVKIAHVAMYFSPTNSITGVFSKVKIAMMDGRFEPPAVIQSVTIGSNVESKVELSMDYSVPKESAVKLFIMVNKEQATMMHGEQWGAVFAQMMIEDSDFPFMSAKKNVVGVIAPTATVLEDFEVDPDILDITMMENDRKRLRSMYQDGDVADEGEPVKERTKAISYAKSNIRSLQKGTKAEGSEVIKPGWEHMAGFRKPQIAAELDSVDPSEEGSEDYQSDFVPVSKEKWQKQQEELRRTFDVKSDTTEEIERDDFPKLKPALKNRPTTPTFSMDELVESSPMSSEEGRPPSPKPRRKGVQFGVSGV